MPLTASWIAQNSDRCGGDACVRDTRIPVWILANSRRLGMTDSQILGAYPTLNSFDLESVWEYVARHSQEIERAIRENEEGEEGFVE